MKDIFNDDSRLVIAYGAPGIGKNTFAWQLCRKWPTQECLRQFSLVVLLRLRDEGVQTAVDMNQLFPNADDKELSILVGKEVMRPSTKAELQSLSQAAIGREIKVVGFSQKEIQEYEEESFKSKPKLLANFQTYISVCHLWLEVYCITH